MYVHCLAVALYRSYHCDKDIKVLLGFPLLTPGERCLVVVYLEVWAPHRNWIAFLSGCLSTLRALPPLLPHLRSLRGSSRRSIIPLTKELGCFAFKLAQACLRALPPLLSHLRLLRGSS